MEINQRIHDKMVTNVLNTKLKFFEENTQGMILNRFSKDVQTLDKIVYTFLDVTDVRLECNYYHYKIVHR
jgi:ABC-type multidrug transport system fused ATPase/permease subunit